MSIITSGPKNDSVLQAIEFLSNIRTFLYPKNLILLGAGASIRYIDNKPNLKKELNNILDENFVNPRIKNQVNKNELKKSEIARFKLQDFNIELHKTVEGELLINDSEDNLYDKFYIRYPMLLPLYALKKFTLDKNKKPCICPEYEIFNWMNKNSCFIDFNHDGLSKKFIKINRPITPHGYLPSNDKEKIEILWEEIICSIDKGMNKFLSETTGKVLRQFYIYTPEIEEELMELDGYISFINCLEHNKFENIFCIGYSFFYHNDVFNDFCTYDRIISYIKNKKAKFFMISPDPEDLLCALQGNYTKNAFYLKWDNLSYSLYFLNYMNALNIKTLSIIYPYMDRSDLNEYCEKNKLCENDEFDKKKRVIKCYTSYIKRLLKYKSVEI